MYFSIERCCGESEAQAKITLGGKYDFSLVVPWRELRDPATRELITSWALGLFTLTGSGIGMSLVENLLDYLEERFPVERPLMRRPPLRKWFNRLW